MQRDCKVSGNWILDCITNILMDRVSLVRLCFVELSASLCVRTVNWKIIVISDRNNKLF